MIKDQIDKINNVLVSIDLNQETKSKNHLNIEFWINPTSLEAYNFITYFKPKLE